MAEVELKGEAIDWTGRASHVVLNPRMHATLQPEAILRQLPVFEGHIWLSTSGTSQTDALKLVALSKKALLISAQAVNDHLRATSKDRWLNVLPLFHVGGLAIYARAHLLGANVISAQENKWDPKSYCELVQSENIQFSSLVPTQVFDLVTAGLEAPSCLRAIVAGGGSLSETLYRRARQLGWPVLPSYGLTECASQVATAPLSSLEDWSYPPLVRLNHVRWHTNGEGRLMIASDALLSAYAFLREERTEIYDPRESGWFVTEDLADLNGDHLTLHGRKDDRIKVSGELVDLFQLNRRFQNMVHNHNTKLKVQLFASPHPRLGQQVDLVAAIEGLNSIPPLAAAFNLTASGVERIHNIYFMDPIPQSALGKIQLGRLLHELGFSDGKS